MILIARNCLSSKHLASNGMYWELVTNQQTKWPVMPTNGFKAFTETSMTIPIERISEGLKLGYELRYSRLVSND